jgi:hypothetical protein
MSTIVTRAGKGSALTHNEVDANFNNLNTDKLQSGNTVSALTITTATINGGTVSGITDLAIADGGTGASTATAAFNALSPVTTKGDIIVRNSTDNIRLAVGTNDHVLTADSAQASGVKWAAVVTGGMTLLGTLNTTSGTSQTLSSLTLTSYSMLIVEIFEVSSSATSGNFTIAGTTICGVSGSAANAINGNIQIMLQSGETTLSVVNNRAIGTVGLFTATTESTGVLSITTATTSIAFALSTGNFDNGVIRVYGVK